MRAMMLPQPAAKTKATVSPTTIGTPNFTVSSDKAMTGHDDAVRVLAVCRPDGPVRLRYAKLSRERTIGHRRAGRDPAQGCPDRLLERGAAIVDVHIIDGMKIAGEIGVQAR